MFEQFFENKSLNETPSGHVYFYILYYTGALCAALFTIKPFINTNLLLRPLPLGPFYMMKILHQSMSWQLINQFAIKRKN